MTASRVPSGSPVLAGASDVLIRHIVTSARGPARSAESCYPRRPCRPAAWAIVASADTDAGWLSTVKLQFGPAPGLFQYSTATISGLAETKACICPMNPVCHWLYGNEVLPHSVMN